MTRDEVDRLRIGDVVKFTSTGLRAGIEKAWVIKEIARIYTYTVHVVKAHPVDIIDYNTRLTKITITDTPEHWTLVERTKQSRPDVHPLEQLRQRLDNNNDS